MNGDVGLRVRPLGPGEVLDDAVLLVRGHFAAFLKVVSWTYLPWSLGMNLALVPWHTRAAEGERFSTEAATVLTAVTAGLMFLDVAVLRQFARGALFALNGRAYRGEPLRRREALGRSLRRLPAAALTTLLTGGLFGAWQVCLLAALYFGPEAALFLGLVWVPTLLFGTLLVLAAWLAVAVVQFEGLGAIRGSLRGMRLSTGSFGTVVLVAAVLALVRIALTATLVLTGNPWLQTGLGVVVDCLLMISETSAETVLYFSIRARQENLDLELLAREVDLAEAGEVEAAAPIGGRRSEIGGQRSEGWRTDG